MKVVFIAFTDNGLGLAQRLAQGLEQQGCETDVTRGFGPNKVNHKAWALHWFHEADALVFISATGIAVRTVAPLLEGKGTDPAVVVLDDRGTNCIPLISGHLGGANNLARTLSDFCGARCVVTTASDVNRVFAVDSWAKSQGVRVPETTGIKMITSALLKGEPVGCFSAFEIDGIVPPGIKMISYEDLLANDGSIPVFHIGCRTLNNADLDLVVPAAVLGIGCRKGTSCQAIEEGSALFLEQAGVHPAAVCGVASIDLKANEPGLVQFAANHKLPFETYSAEVLNAQEGEFSSSEFVTDVTGTNCVCERAACVNSKYLLTKKTVINGITFAIAIKDFSLMWPEVLSCGAFAPSEDPEDLEMLNATPAAEEPTLGESELIVVGLGPGDPAFMSQEAVAALQDADVLCGYHVYVDLAKAVAPDTPVFTTPMTKEIDRCRAALEMAAQGKRVAMVCSGDAGVYGMAGLCMELAHEFSPVDIRVIPGITAALSGASRLGAPLTHDFCVISLSDLLTPWELIEQRLSAAAQADFCVALYNPASKKRSDYLQKACDLMLAGGKGPNTICGIVRNIGRPGEETWVGTLEQLRTYPADMFCTVFIGNSNTVIIDGKMVTPRGYQKKRQWNKEA